MKNKNTPRAPRSVLAPLVRDLENAEERRDLPPASSPYSPPPFPVPASEEEADAIARARALAWQLLTEEERTAALRFDALTRSAARAACGLPPLARDTWSGCPEAIAPEPA